MAEEKENKMFSLELNFKQFLIESQAISQLLKTSKQWPVAGVKVLRKEYRNNLMAAYPALKQPAAIKQLDKLVNYYVYWSLHYFSLNNNEFLQSLQQEKDPSKIEEMFRAISAVGYNSARRWMEESGDYLINAINTGNAAALSKLNDPSYAPEMLSADSKHWHELLASKKRIPGGEGNTIINLDKVPGFKGWKWLSLGRGSCRYEADAGGHCGNAGEREGDNILSLRDEGNRVHLTFIVNNKVLGEMKGHGNHKPSPQFHPAIVPLLMSKYVESIKGGGYMPEANFGMNDLDEVIRNKIIKAKPYMDQPFDYLMGSSKNDEDLMGRIQNLFPGTSMENVRTVGKERFVVLDSWSDWEDTQKGLEGHGANFRSNLSNLDNPNFDRRYDVDMSEAIGNLSKENIKKIESYLDQKEKDGDIEFWNDDISLEEKIAEDDDLESAIKDAAYRGWEWGSQAAEYSDAVKQLEDLDGHFYVRIFKDGYQVTKKGREYPFELCVNVDSLKEIYNSPNFDADEHDVASTMKFSFDDREHYEFDEEHFNDEVIEQASWRGINL